MNERNPYESDDTVDIPDFSSIKVNDDDIDRSVFKMNDDIPSCNEPEFDDDYYDDEEDEGRSINKTNVIMIAIMVVLLILAVFGMFWGISKNKAYTTLKTEYDAYVTKAQTTETELNNKIIELQNQINSANTTTTVPTGESATYKMTATVRIRTGAGTSNAQTKFADLSDDVKKVASDDGGVAFMAAGTVFTAGESKEDSDKNVWVKLADNAWVCVKFGDATWATKQ